MDPGLEQLPDIDARVAQQPIDLLDRVLVGLAARLRQTMTDHRHGEGSARQDPKRAKSK